MHGVLLDAILVVAALDANANSSTCTYGNHYEHIDLLRDVIAVENLYIPLNLGAMHSRQREFQGCNDLFK